MKHTLRFLLCVSLVLFGFGCEKKSAEVPAPAPQEQQQTQQPEPTQMTPEENKTKGTWVHPKYLFSFTLPLDVGSKFMYASPDTIEFHDPATQNWYGDMIIQSEIPEPPLTGDKIEEVMLDGVKGKIFHDKDAQTGTQKVDRLMVLMPGTNKTIAFSVDGEPGGKINLQEVVKTWKWGK